MMYLLLYNGRRARDTLLSLLLLLYYNIVRVLVIVAFSLYVLRRNKTHANNIITYRCIPLDRGRPERAVTLNYLIVTVDINTL
jgi:hypothetical protein